MKENETSGTGVGVSENRPPLVLRCLPGSLCLSAYHYKCFVLLFPTNQRRQLKYGARAMLHEQCLAVQPTIGLSLEMFTWEVCISLSQASKRSLAGTSLPTVVTCREWESCIPGRDSSPVWQLWRPVARNLQLRAEFQKGMDCA